MKRLFACTLMLFAAAPSLAADANGYTAKYECRAGGQYCDVDVAALASQQCQQTIFPSTSPTNNWSAIDWSKNVICIAAGDHTSRGTLTIPSWANGTAANRKVLRYTRDSDSNNDEPWNQGANQAKIHALDISGAYWIMHRLSIVPTTAPTSNLAQITGSNNIFNRNLVVGPHLTSSGVGISGSVTDITIQNNLIYADDSSRVPGDGSHGINATSGTNIRVVNNELYDWQAHDIQVGNNSNPTMPGYVIENNDFYITSAVVQPNGEAYAKATMSIKATATSEVPAKIIHNRFWNSRKSDYSMICCSPGTAINVVTPVDYLLIKDNIVTDSQSGLAWAYSPSTRQSVIGNLFYNITPYANFDSNTLELGQLNTAEVYLNTFIGGSRVYVGYGLGATDVRCNAFLSLTVDQNGTPDADTQMDLNVFYDSTPQTYNGTKTDIDKNKSVTTRTNSTAYNLNDIIRTSAVTNCVNGTESACFLYKVITAGTTAGTAPPYCTSLGCTVTDDKVSLKAIRGPYTFYRKLRTSPELYTIPYARAYVSTTNPSASAPEAGACPSNYATRGGIGINDVN